MRVARRVFEAVLPFFYAAARINLRDTIAGHGPEVLLAAGTVVSSRGSSAAFVWRASALADGL